MDYDDPTPGQDLHIHLKAGYQKLSGEEAMQLVRWRKNNTGSSGGDVARNRHPAGLPEGGHRPVPEAGDPAEGPQFGWQIFMDNVDTDLSIGNILALAQRAAGGGHREGRHLRHHALRGGPITPGVSMVLPVVSELVRVLNDTLDRVF